ncbi:hypothetical protein BGW80DRAFT_461692 [Lactifluus volemus]|nr:hypothetical protein BGW80DRAFT_461692 [Lactifluus volemus]
MHPCVRLYGAGCTTTGLTISRLAGAGPHAGHIAVIAEIIDHNRGSHRRPYNGPSAPGLSLSPPHPHTPHRSKTSTQRQLWHCEEIRRKAEVVAKWESTVMAHKKSRRDKVRKVLKAAKA